MCIGMELKVVKKALLIVVGVLMFLTAMLSEEAYATEASDLSNPLLWYDANDASSIVKDGSNNVSQWNDKSGNGHHLTEYDSKGEFTFIENSPTANNNNVIYVDGTDLFVAENTSGNTAIGDITIFGIYKLETHTPNKRPLGFGSTVVDGFAVQGKHINWSTAPKIEFDGVSSTEGYSESHPTTYFVRSMTRSGDTFTEYFNGDQVYTEDIELSNTIVDDFAVGVVRHDKVFNGYLAEIIVYDRVLDTATRKNVENYLASKWFIIGGSLVLEGVDSDGDGVDDEYDAFPADSGKQAEEIAFVSPNAGESFSYRTEVDVSVNATVATAYQNNRNWMVNLNSSVGSSGAGTGTIASLNSTVSLEVTAGTHTLYARLVDNAGNIVTSANEITQTFTIENTAPSISGVSDQTTTEDVMVTFNFTVSDADSNDGDLTISFESGNTSLIDVEDIASTNTGGTVSVNMTPKSGQYGSTTITINVSDGELSTSSVFTFTVNEADTDGDGYTDSNDEFPDDPTRATPSITIESPSNGASYPWGQPSVNVVVSYNVNESFDGYVAYVTGNATFPSSGASGGTTVNGFIINIPTTQNTTVTVNVALVDSNGDIYHDSANDFVTINIEQQVTINEVSLPSISGLALWLDGADAANITTYGSNKVSTWSDKSGNNRHANSETGDYNPTYVENAINGKSAIEFDDDKLILGNKYIYSTSSGLTIVAVAKHDGTADDQGFIYDFGKYGGYSYGLQVRQTEAVFHTPLQHDGAKSEVSYPTSSEPQVVVGRVEFNGDQDIIVNDRYQTTTVNAISQLTASEIEESASAGSQQGPVTIGGVSKTGDESRRYNGYIAEVLVYTELLSDADIDALEDYLARKWYIGEILGASLDTDGDGYSNTVDAFPDDFYKQAAEIAFVSPNAGESLSYRTEVDVSINATVATGYINNRNWMVNLNSSVGSSGAGTGTAVSLNSTASLDVNPGTHTMYARLVDYDGIIITSANEITRTITIEANTTPNIVGLSTISVTENAVDFEVPFNFSIWDLETASGDLMVTVSTSDARLVSSITTSNEDGNVGVTLNIMGRVFGNTALTVLVSDGVFSTSNTVTLTVINDPGVTSDFGNGDVILPDNYAVVITGNTLAGKLSTTGQLTLGDGVSISLDGYEPDAGDSYDLFDWGTLMGTFNVVTLPTLNTGLAWSLEELYANGEIEVIGVPGSLMKPLIMWFDAADAGTLVSGEQGIFRWLDKSGNNAHVSGNAKSDQGEYNESGQNNIGTVSLEGDLFEFENVPELSGDEGTYIAVVKVNSSHFNSDDNSLFNNGQMAVRKLAADSQFQAFLRDTSDNYLTLKSQKVESERFYLVTMYYTGTELTIRINGTPVQNKQVIDIKDSAVTNVFSSASFYGELGEVLFFDGALEITEIDRIEQLLSKKWGIYSNTRSFSLFNSF